MNSRTKVAAAWIVAAALVVAAFAAGVAYGTRHRHSDAQVLVSETTKRTGYHCPMHPNFRSDKPGQCGICGMNLVPDEEPSGNTPVQPGNAAAMPPGTFRVSPEKQQLVGVKTGVVESDSMQQAVRATGRVVADETRIARVQTRIEGWIDKVYVDFTGKRVQKGDPLLTLYSPEMLATQQEYLLALKSREILRGSGVSTLRNDSDGLVEAAKRRMQLWGLSDAQIKQVETTQKPLTNITIYSPVSGYVTVKNAFPKQRITPETELYTIVDLSTVWVMADVYEADAAGIHIGQRAIVTATAYPGERLPATVSYIQPQVDPQTRTLKVRLELGNARMQLMPDMYVEVNLFAGSKARLVVPVGAVLNTGLRQTVFVDRGNGILEPRRVQVGKQSGDRIEILSGLTAGERIVTSGTFLIDSESQLRAAASGNGAQKDVAPAASPAETPSNGRTAAPDAHGAHRHD